MTQQPMAGLLNISQATASRYESGALYIPSSSLNALAKFYSTSVEDLLGLTDNPKPDRKK